MALHTPRGHGLGLRLDVPRDPRNWIMPLAPLTAPPPSVIDLRGLHPFGIQDQGQEGSCTAFAGCKALEWHLAKRDTPGSVVKLSEAFAYYVNRREDGSSPSQDTGASSQSICKAFAQYGAADASLMPYQAGNYQTAPSTAAVQDAATRRMVSYYQVNPQDLLGGVWALLSAGYIVLMGFQVPRSFETMVGSDGKVPAPNANDDILGGHEVLLDLWIPDATAPGGEGWLGLPNSWGTGIGDGGRFLVSTAYWRAGLIMDHMVPVLAQQPAPTPPSPTPTPTPTPDDVVTQIDGICDEVARLVGVVQAEPVSAAMTKTQLLTVLNRIRGSDVGPIKNYAAQIQALLKGPSPTPTPTPGPTFALPCVQGGILGQTKWLAGSLGCDVFVPDNSPAYFCCDGVVEEVIGGTGLNGGAEIIYAAPDKSVAFRHRHCQVGVKVGDRAVAGQSFGVYHDTSLNMLCPQPVAGYPGGWQHCDLSYNEGTDQFAPTGGGGGNRSAFAWLEAHGYQGTVVGRTPGPPSCGLSEAEAVRFLTPWARR